ncbi:alpha-amylase family glycosyl hydrolase [Roseisolibacter agri]|uniref:Alpha-amylase n=1 Tax=Roseisolibacter agri TaxID=2014610 RepID=A0AA37PZX6_9BACT|nr:alpha-amylase family glycosyl hydrolase [Roseisolibacter agri]GLC23929.1 alpha-amylase [Roseisolibacter agri]
MRSLTLALAAALALVACGGPPAADVRDSAAATPAPGATPAVTSVAHPEWTRTASIYEVNVRQFTPEGTIAALQRHLPRLDSLGVDILWLMPVQPIGKKNRKGPLGSYYSIADYRAINPEFGTTADMRALVDAAHAQGLKVILDWVPNHTAFDHPWITQHPDWYVKNPDGTISNARDNEGRPTDWTDVAELDYTKPAMRQAMLADMRYWIDSMKVDGFRCDVAGGVPDDFWAEARQALQAAKPDVFLLAEAESPKAHAAFDMTYGWELHHLLNELAKGKKPTSALDAYLAKQDSAYPREAMRMYFTSNHDENSWQGTEFERMKANHLPAFVLAATMQNGMPLVYTGQEVSMNKRLRFFEKDTVNWSGPSLAGFYRRMLALKDSQPALANGGWGGRQVALQTNGGDRVYAFTRTQGENTVLVAVNFGDAAANVTYEGLPQPGAYTDWFDRKRAELAASGSLTIPAHGYRVLVR